MSDGRKFEQAILAIHETLNKAERQLARLGRDLGQDLGGDLQFVIGLDGDAEIVRRDQSRGHARPKILVARLSGTDPMMWRADYPPWLRALEPRPDAEPMHPPAANGDGGTENGGSTPPATPGGQS